MLIDTITVAGIPVADSLVTYGYIVLIAIFILEGTVTGFVAGVLAGLGFFNPFLVFLLYVGVRIVTDTFVYYIARSGTNALGKFPLTKKLMRKIDTGIEGQSEWVKFIRQHVGKAMMIAKIAPMPTLPEIVLITSGMMKIPIRKIYPSMIAGQIIWAAVIVSLGFFYGDTITSLKEVIQTSVFIGALIILLFFFYQRYMHEFLKSRFGSSDFLDDESEEKEVDTSGDILEERK